MMLGIWGVVTVAVTLAVSFVLTECGAEKSQRSLEPPVFPRIDGGQNSAIERQYNYSVIFDVGSTGTRAYAFAYKWNPDGCYGRGAIKLFMPGWSRKTKPGLSEVWRTAHAQLTDTNVNQRQTPEVKKMIEHYLEPLRQFIVDNVFSKDQLARTILMVHATGGFRALDSEIQTMILDQMYLVLLDWGPSRVRRSWLRVLEGEEEGAYAWLAVNQLARRFYGEFEQVELHPELKNQSSSDGDLDPLPGAWRTDNWGAVSRGTAARRLKRRVGMIEVGGASAQVVVEPANSIRNEYLETMPPSVLAQAEPALSWPAAPAVPDQHFSLLKFCYQNFILQIQTLDGFGREAAFQNFLRYQALKSKVKPGEAFGVQCLPTDAHIPVYLDTAPGSKSVAYAYGDKFGTHAGCQTIMREFLAEKSSSYPKMELDADYRVYATENFYYFNQYVAKSNLTLFSTSNFLTSAEMLCNGSSLSEVKSQVHSEIAEDKLPAACFGLVFLSEIMQMTVALKQDQLVKAVTAIKELETSYTVGSLLVEIPFIYRELANDHISTPHQDEL